MEEKKYRVATLYKNYFADFLSSQSNKVKAKIVWVIKLIETQQTIPSEFFKHIAGTDGIYEIRVQYGSDAFRIFCFFDEGNLILLANGFKKQSQKTPKSEIKRAQKIKTEYENEKKSNSS